MTISHQLEVKDLTSATTYTCVMKASGDITEEIMITTSRRWDTTAPQILNIRTTTDDRRLWFLVHR